MVEAIAWSKLSFDVVESAFFLEKELLVGSLVHGEIIESRASCSWDGNVLIEFQMESSDWCSVTIVIVVVDMDACKSFKCTFLSGGWLNCCRFLKL